MNRVRNGLKKLVRYCLFYLWLFTGGSFWDEYMVALGRLTYVLRLESDEELAEMDKIRDQRGE